MIFVKYICYFTLEDGSKIVRTYDRYDVMCKHLEKLYEGNIIMKLLIERKYYRENK